MRTPTTDNSPTADNQPLINPTEKPTRKHIPTKTLPHAEYIGSSLLQLLLEALTSFL
ncbi:hypothetical protein K7432_007762 [Basidiobolus ranarum]|uniref:Uncharacterized protein n=1 Tax=Basidiobolus ranarum TaxID=34480 RepID=A0ABR2VZM2_9FUNG